MFRQRAITLVIFISCLLIMGCGAVVKYKPMGEFRSPKAENFLLTVYQTADEIPIDYEVIGKINVDDSGLTLTCGYEKMMRILKKKALDVGADAIRIIEIESPDFFSSCYRISALAIAYKDAESSF